jgi:alpha-amylase
MSPRIMLWANYRQKYNVSVPCPMDNNDPRIPWWYDKISSLAHEWAEWGITDVLFPQPLKTNAGHFPGADGYGVYDDYDIGSKNTGQFGGMPTRFGYADQLRRAVAICHANGLNVLIDHVMHQRMGGRAGVYRYDSATQKGLGRFPKDPPCFRGAPPRVPQDPVPAPADDFSFGDELCPINGQPENYVAHGLIDAGDWLFRTLDADGARLDDMKGMNVGFMKRFMTSGAMKGKWFFGEFASGSRDSWWGGLGTNWWVNEVDGLASAADFDYHYHVAMPLCNQGGTFTMSDLAGRGMIGNNPMKAVPFVESMDSDVNGFATVVFNKELGYAHLLGGEGLPCIYYRDWAMEPNCYGLKHQIENLCWCAHTLAGGPTIPRPTDNPRIFAYERIGQPGLLVVLSNDIWNPEWNTVTIQTGFGAHVHLHDFNGHNQADAWTDANGRVTLGVPPAGNGKGYGMWSRAEYQGRMVQQRDPRATSQDFEGTDDLDIAPLFGTALHKVGRVWAEEGTELSLRMMNFEGKPPDFPVQMMIKSPDGTELASGRSDHVYDHTVKRGWHTLWAMAPGVADGARIPFRLNVYYTAPQHLREDEWGM